MVTVDWNEKAERLRAELSRLNSAQIDGVVDDPVACDAQERVLIARFLRQEFSDELEDDTQTLALFPVEANPQIRGGARP